MSKIKVGDILRVHSAETTQDVFPVKENSIVRVVNMASPHASYPLSCELVLGEPVHPGAAIKFDYSEVEIINEEDQSRGRV